MHQIETLKKTFIFNSDSLKCLFWELCMQLIVSLSTLCMIKVSKEATDGNMETSLFYLIGFVSCLTIVYFPNMMARVYITKWQNTALGKFVAEFSKVHRGKPLLARREERAQIEPWLTSEARATYDDVCDSAYQLFSTFMNCILNILVLGVVLSPSLLLAYCIAAIFLFLTKFFFTKKINELAKLNQDSRNNLTHTLLHGFGNIVGIGNLGLKNWTQSFLKDLRINRNTQGRYVLFQSMASMVGIVLALCVVVIAVGSYLVDNLDNNAAFMAMVITIPRQVQIIQSGFYFFTLVVDWGGQITRLRELFTLGLKAINVNTHEQDVCLEKISIFHEQKELRFLHWSQLTEFFADRKNGRFTIRGPNGVGKSTLLSLLSNRIEGNKALLPTNLKDSYLSQDRGLLTGSDGDKVREALSNREYLEELDYLFVDEWDANLDDPNSMALSQIIDRLSKDAVVIEIRHRGQRRVDGDLFSKKNADNHL